MTATKRSLGGSLAKYKGLSDGNAEGRGAPRVADDAEDRPELGHPGLRHHQDPGRPQHRNRHMILPATGYPRFLKAEAFASVGMTITGMPALNAMPSVCAAPPGDRDQRRPSPAGLRRPFPGHGTVRRGASGPTEDMGGPLPVPASPNGWFSVGAGDDLPPGDVTPVHYLERDLVVFRGEDGVARVFDAHCPHLGAHLGVGGRVCGDGITCPFHGWRFDGDGRLVEVPGLDRTPRAAARAWEVCERNGRIFVWHHAGGAPTVLRGGRLPGDEASWTPWRRRHLPGAGPRAGPDGEHHRPVALLDRARHGATGERIASRCASPVRP